MRAPLYILIVVFGLGIWATPAEGGSGKKWNVIFFLVDDLGWSDLGYEGSRLYDTPNVDRFARQGVRFTEAYAACPVCSPTRGSILTGEYPARLHLTDWLAGSMKVASASR